MNMQENAHSKLTLAPVKYERLGKKQKRMLTRILYFQVSHDGLSQFKMYFTFANAFIIFIYSYIIYLSA